MFPIAAFLKTPPFTSHFKWEYGSQALSSSERVLFFAMLFIAVLISPFTYYFKWEYDSQALLSSEHVLCLAMLPIAVLNSPFHTISNGNITLKTVKFRTCTVLSNASHCCLKLPRHVLFQMGI